MDKCILFGAGKYGKSLMEFMISYGIDEYVYGYCDTNKEKVGNIICNRPVLDYNDAKAAKLPIIVSVESEQIKKEISDILEHDGMVYYMDIFYWLNSVYHMDSTELNRAYCAYYHLDKMNSYFDEAELTGGIKGIERFWDINSPFYNLFNHLELDNVIELACGRGRHVEHYYKNAQHVTLIDILEKNIDICRERFSGYKNISYYVNNGYDLRDLKDDLYSALFTYDAMVHFEMFDIYSYLKETYRVLHRGGKALFHHSNLALKYDQSFKTPYNPGGRNFMDKKLFAYLSYKAGFEIIEQKEIDWSLPKMDCLTLVEKR